MKSTTPENSAHETGKPYVLSFRLLVLTILLSIPLSSSLFGQTIPAATLQQLAFIPIPTWTTSGATAASFDVLSYNRVTGSMYIADRPNKGATVIDTKTMAYIGTIVLPGCAQTPTCSPSGVLVIPDLQKLIVTDRDKKIYIYDLRVPSQSPIAILPSPPGSDELDYDPLNQRAYIGNTTSDFAVTVVDMKNNVVLGSIWLATAPEQPRFNPVDGLIYVSSPGSNQVVKIDPEKGPFGEVIGAFAEPGAKAGDCSNAIDIDPISNTALLGCSVGQSAVMELTTGGTLASFPTSGTDIGMFNPHNRRWYMGGDNRNTPASVSIPCPKGSDGRTGVLEVYSNFPTPAQFVGVVCGGRGGIRAGVDPVLNNIYYPVVQYPPNPASADTGAPGVLVFHDPVTVTGTPTGTLQALSRTTLASVGGSGINGTVEFSLRRRNMFISGSLTGLAPGSTDTVLMVTTTAGNESLSCGVNASGAGFCQGYLVGDPLINGVVAVGSGRKRVASGTVTLVSTIPPFLDVD